MIPELRERFKDVQFDRPDTLVDRLRPILSNRNSGHDLAAGADPHISSRVDRKVVNIVVFPQNGQNRMPGSGKDHIGRHHGKRGHHSDTADFSVSA